MQNDAKGRGRPRKPGALPDAEAIVDLRIRMRQPEGIGSTRVLAAAWGWNQSTVVRRLPRLLAEIEFASQSHQPNAAETPSGARGETPLSESESRRLWMFVGAARAIANNVGRGGLWTSAQAMKMLRNALADFDAGRTTTDEGA